MLEQDPGYIGLLFITTTLITILIFAAAAGNSKPVFYILLAWVGLQSIPALYGFYTVTYNVPPRFALLAGPPFLLILILFLIPAGRSFIDGLKPHYLTWLHTVRIPVEIGLWLHFTMGTVPELMTFEGRNFDILAGITAPFVAYLVFIRKSAGKKLLLIWNFISLALVVNVIINAILAAPTPFQQWGFEQPNIGLLYFPFIWLPACIVPLVVFSHLAVIRQILTEKHN
jgi:hypothetical protein